MMDYTILQAKRTLQKHQKKIVIASLVLIVFAFILVLIHNASDHKQTLRNPSIVDLPTPRAGGGATSQGTSGSKETRIIKDYTLVNTYVRNGEQYYTQGLMFADENTLLESTGLKGESRIQYLSLPDLKVIKTTEIGYQYFGEGCQIYEENGKKLIYQLTWQERKILVWNADDLTLNKEIPLPAKIREGWGITLGDYKGVNGVQKAFYISDGSSNIYVCDPSDFRIMKTLAVKQMNGKEINRLNELEMIKGKIWANIYYQNLIAIVDPETGLVDTYVDLSPLRNEAWTKANQMNLLMQGDYVLNGIAYDEANDRLIIAGKKWPLMWEIKVPGV